jgi:cytosine/adenosine deaminase-related metal-dependent hydrolase
MILRARTVLPVSRPPVANGAVAISGNRIAAVGLWKNFTRYASRMTHHDIFDLGEVILLPGLVNAHCHLDYTDMAGELLPPKSFTDWIKLITEAKGGWTYSDFAQSWLNGARMLLRYGTTTVADFENVPELLPEAWNATPASGRTRLTRPCRSFCGSPPKPLGGAAGFWPRTSPNRSRNLKCFSTRAA